MTLTEGSDLRPSWPDVFMYFKAFIAMHGSVVMWVGFWDLLNEGVEE
jgi:hypothetical protein